MPKFDSDLPETLDWLAGFVAGLALLGGVFCLLEAFLLPLTLDWVEGPASTTWRRAMIVGAVAGGVGGVLAFLLLSARKRAALAIASAAAVLSLGSCIAVPQLLSAAGVHDEAG